MDIKDTLAHKIQVLMEEMVFLQDKVETGVLAVVEPEVIMEEVLEQNLVMTFHSLEAEEAVQIFTQLQL